MPEHDKHFYQHDDTTMHWVFMAISFTKIRKNKKHSYSLQWQISIMSIHYMQQEWSW